MINKLMSFQIELRVPASTREWLDRLAEKSRMGAVGFFSLALILGARQLEDRLRVGLPLAARERQREVHPRRVYYS